MIRRFLLKMLFRLGRAYWVLDEDGEPGFIVFGVHVGYHKWHDTFMIYKPGAIKYRVVEKRELQIPVEKF